jgi:opacity protein-like surface antigen
MNWLDSRRLVWTTFCVVLATLFGTNIALAQDSVEADTDQWRYSAGLYLWFADIGGKTADGTSVDVGFSDLVDNLEMGFMGKFSAQKGKWVVVTDVIYLDVSAKDTINTSIPVGPGAIDVTAKAELDLTGAVIQIAGGYNALDGSVNSLNVMGGARYLDLDTDVRLSLEALAPGRSVELSENGNIWDVIVGLKGTVALAERWSLPYYLDVGTGDSDLTYQASAGISYRISESFNVALAYRYLKWEFDSGVELQDISFDGAMLGVVYRF